MALRAFPARGQQLPKPLDKNPEPRGAAELHVHLPGPGCQGGFKRYRAPTLCWPWRWEIHAVSFCPQATQ